MISFPNPITINTTNTLRRTKGGFMLLPAILATTLTACPQPPAPPPEQPVETRALTSSRDVMLHGIVAGTTFNANQSLVLNNASVFANAGLVLNSRNLSLNGNLISSTSAATCTDNSGQGLCVNGKPKFVSALVSVPKPDFAALKTKYNATPTTTIQGSLNLNSSLDISAKFDNQIVLVKGNLHLHAIATIKNAVIIVTESFKSNKGLTLENSRIIAKEAQFNQTSSLTNSRILTDEDLSFNGKLESAGLSSVVTNKNFTSNGTGLTSSSGELAVIASQNISLNQVSSGKMMLWAGSNITVNQNLNLEGAMVAGGKVVLNSSVSVKKVSYHLNSDVLGGGQSQLPIGTRDETTLKAGSTAVWWSKIGIGVGVSSTDAIQTDKPIFAEIADPTKLKPLPGGKIAAGLMYQVGSTNPAYTKEDNENGYYDYVDNDNGKFEFYIPIPEGETKDSVGLIEYLPAWDFTDRENNEPLWSTTYSRPDSTGKYLIVGYPALYSKDYAVVFALIRRSNSPKSNTNMKRDVQKINVVCDAEYTPVNCDTDKDPINSITQIGLNQLNELINTMGLTDKEMPKLGNGDSKIHIRLLNRDAPDCESYRRAEEEVRICINDKNETIVSMDIALRHEIFHSIQHGLVTNKRKELRLSTIAFSYAWIVEGGARSSEQSDKTAMRTEEEDLINSLPNFAKIRKITEHITKPESRYYTQDFWVYIGQKLGLGLGYQTTIFRQINKAAVPGVINQKDTPLQELNAALLELGYNGGLKKAYLDWVRYQGLEKDDKISLHRWKSGDQCVINGLPDSISPDFLRFRTSHSFASGDPTDLQSSDENPDGVSSLETRVASVTFTDTGDLHQKYNQLPMLLRVLTPKNRPVDPSKIKYKWYLDQRPDVVGNKKCQFSQDQDLFYRPSQPSLNSSPPRIVVLISNIDTTSRNGDNVKDITKRESGLEQFKVKVQRIMPELETPTAITLKSKINEPTTTKDFEIGNKGDVLSDLEYVSYPVSTEPALVDVPGQFPTAPTPDKRFENPASTGASGTLHLPEPKKPTVKKLSLGFRCVTAGTFTSSVSVAYKTGRLLESGDPEILVQVIPVTVTCDSTTLLASSVNETINGYMDNGKFVYEALYPTIKVQNKSTQLLSYRAKTSSSFTKVLREDRTAPANAQDYVDLELKCPNGPGDYVGQVDFADEATGAALPVTAETKLTCKAVAKPTLTPEEASKPASAGVYSDPHIHTFDEVFYEGQKAGEFILVKNPTDGFEVQTRYQDVTDSQIWSQTTAVSLRINGSRIGVYLKSDGSLGVLVDGQGISADNRTQTLASGVTISQNSRFDVAISSTSGYAIGLNGGLSSLDVQVPPKARGVIRGLLGDANGNQLDDFKLRDGNQIQFPIGEPEISRFMESWRINSSESLFDYAVGESNQGFTNLSFPQNKKYFFMFPVQVRETAQQICEAAKIVTPAVFRNCLFDVGLTGDEIWARIAERVDPANKFVAIVPGSLTLERSGTASLQAFASQPKAIADLVWTATGGNLSQSVEGVVQYTAPTIPGTYQVRSSLRDDSSVFDEILIVVSPPPPFASTLTWYLGQSLMLGLRDTTEVWGINNGSRTVVTQGENHVASAVPDGSQWIVYDGINAKIVNAQQILCTLEDVGGDLGRLTFGNHGRFVVGGSPTTGVVLWDAQTCRVAYRFANAKPRAISLSEDGERLAYLENSKDVVILNVSTGAEISRTDNLNYRFISTLVISPDGLSVVVTGSTSNDWDVFSKLNIATNQWVEGYLGYGASATRILFSPDGAKIAFIRPDELDVIDVNTLDKLYQQNNPYDQTVLFEDGAWNQDGTLFALIVKLEYSNIENVLIFDGTTGRVETQISR
jgi:von Willebrand factor type D domain